VPIVPVRMKGSLFVRDIGLNHGYCASEAYN